MKKGFMIAAIVLIVAGIVVFGSAFMASGFDFSKLDVAEYETNTYTLSEAFETIEIKSEEADVKFKLSEDGKTRIDCIERDKTKHEVSIENGALKIIAVDKRAWYDPLTFFSLKAQSIVICLPSEQYKALTVSTDTGDVSVPDSFSFADAKITTSTGDINMIGIRAATIDLSVSTGRIDVKNVDCQKTLTVKASTGKTFLTDVFCESLVSSGSTGDIILKNTVASESFNIQSNTGNVRMENCDAEQIIVRTSTGDVTGTIRSEKVFIAKTSTGDIDVPNTVSGGRCEITTSTGDIRITIPN